MKQLYTLSEEKNECETSLGSKMILRNKRNKKAVSNYPRLQENVHTPDRNRKKHV